MRKVLDEDFFERDARVVARELLGKYLVRRVRGKARAYKIIETEAYLGPHDLASHARHGKTKRNAVMHGPPGRWYIYFVYGMHYLLNIVTGPEGEPSGVLIRGVEGLPRPGVLTRTLRTDLALNAKKAASASGLWIEDRGERVAPRSIKTTPRIGIGYAGAWAKKPLRFLLRAAGRARRARRAL
jgi:DNA-3-methyladenine glycosylase